MDNGIYKFIIVKKDGITPEQWMRRLMREMHLHNEMVISSQISCENMTRSILDDILCVGGWFREREGKEEIEITPKGKKKYKQIAYECLIKREVWNKRK